MNIRNKTGYHTDPTNTREIMRNYSQQLYTHKLDNLDEMNPFLNTHTQDEIDNLSNLITIRKLNL